MGTPTKEGAPDPVRDILTERPGILGNDLVKALMWSTRKSETTVRKLVRDAEVAGFIRLERGDFRTFRYYWVENPDPVHADDARVVRRNPAEWFHMERVMPRFADPISWGMHHCLRAKA